VPKFAKELQYLFKKNTVPTSLLSPKREVRYLRNIIIFGSVIAFLLLQMLVMELLKNSMAVSEWWTITISQFVVIFAGHISALFPFSIFEVLVILAIMFAFRGVFRIIKKLVIACKLSKAKRIIIPENMTTEEQQKQYRHKVRLQNFYPFTKSLAILLIILFAALNWYNVAAGFSHSRRPLHYGIPMSTTTHLGEDVTRIATYFFDDFAYVSSLMERDENGNTIIPYTRNQVKRLVENEFRRLRGNPYFFQFSPRLKSVQNSWWLSSTGIAGIAFLPTAEPHINWMPHPTSLPMVMAHEMAHALGVMREHDADLVAWHILLTSENPFLRYSAYLSSIGWMENAVFIGNNRNHELANEFWQMFPQEARNERRNMWNWWQEYRGPFAWLDDTLRWAGTFFNDLFLRCSGVEDGVGSYTPPPSETEPEEIEDEETGEVTVIYHPTFNTVQNLFFAIYEGRFLIK